MYKRGQTTSFVPLLLSVVVVVVTYLHSCLLFSIAIPLYRRPLLTKVHFNRRTTSSTLQQNDDLSCPCGFGLGGRVTRQDKTRQGEGDHYKAGQRRRSGRRRTGRR
ncbi:hypothetical protein CC2G_001774 [Coprinopsis cinerea AmutBmut pab1-1]|nr:hypothetical protein CC2G_001774 [Coprinopsis cinerea AmutBmut pab1-1]